MLDPAESVMGCNLRETVSNVAQFSGIVTSGDFCVLLGNNGERMQDLTLLFSSG